MAKLLYQGHGSFRLIFNDKTVVYIDPFAGKGYDVEADYILITHEHGDHNKADIVPKKIDTRVFRAADFLKTGMYSSMALGGGNVTAVPAYNKNHSPDKCVGFVIETDGLKLYFAGDTSTTSAMGTILRDMKLDYAFLPTDGIYNMDVSEASECSALIGAKHSVPVHMVPGGLFSDAVADRFDIIPIE